MASNKLLVSAAAIRDAAPAINDWGLVVRGLLYDANGNPILTADLLDRSDQRQMVDLLGAILQRLTEIRDLIAMTVD